MTLAQMKIKQVMLSSFILVMIAFVSCKDSESDSEQRNKRINNWIYENMSFYYLWNEQMPQNPDYLLNPEPFFESLLYPYNLTTHEGDRFSWIQESYVDLLNALSGVSSSDVGFEYYTVNNYSAYTIVYVKPDTDAASKGLKRGMMITAVDGQSITRQNYTALLRAGQSQYQLSLLDPETNGTETKTVSVQGNYAENPIYYAATFDNDAIGYLVYNFFAADKGDQTSSYDRALNNTLDEFKTKGVKNLILDLRYNGGGAISSALMLVSALVDNRSADNIVSKNQFNRTYGDALIKKYGQEILNEYFFDKVTRYNDDESITEFETVTTLGNQLEGVYILTGQYTASASELVINCLKPYIGNRLHLIGDLTYGKNVGSISIYEKNNPRNKWGMQPIVLKTANRDDFSDYGGGFEPEQFVKEFEENEGKLLPLGDENEPLLAAALFHIANKAYKTSSVAKRAGDFTVKASSMQWKEDAMQMYINSKKYKVESPGMTYTGEIE